MDFYAKIGQGDQNSMTGFTGGLQYIYIQPEENGAVLFFGIKRFIDNYNYHRRHQGINRTVPSKLYIRQAAWS